MAYKKRSSDPQSTATTNASFVDHISGEHIQSGGEADFLNGYFIIIVHSLNVPFCDKTMDDIYNVESIFSFTDKMPTVPEVFHLIKGIGVNKSSCVENGSSKFC